MALFGLTDHRVHSCMLQGQTTSSCIAHLSCRRADLRNKRLMFSRCQAGVSATDPYSLVQDCLACMRKMDVHRFQGHVIAERQVLGDRCADQAWELSDAGPDGGPLGALSHVLDVGARRVLPGHLLRRSQVLSSLQLQRDSFVQRTAVTACGGEEATLEWTLAREAAADGLRWRVAHVSRDPTGDLNLPDMPHPRSSPESVILAQLHALRRGDVEAPCRFMLRLGGGRQQPQQQPYFAEGDRRLLIRHTDAALGRSALLSPRRLLQEVRVVPAHSGAASEHPRACCFVWSMCMKDSGAWMVESIVPQQQC